MRKEKNETNETVRLALVHAFDWEYGYRNKSALMRWANARRPFLFDRFGYELMDDQRKVYVTKMLYAKVFGARRLILYVDQIDCLVDAAFKHAKEFCEKNEIEFIALRFDDTKRAFVEFKEIKSELKQRQSREYTTE